MSSVATLACGDLITGETTLAELERRLRAHDYTLRSVTVFEGEYHVRIAWEAKGGRKSSGRSFGAGKRLDQAFAAAFDAIEVHS